MVVITNISSFKDLSGLGYSQYRNKNLDSLFKKMTKDVRNGVSSQVMTEYLDGITWTYLDNGKVKGFTLRGDVAMHIVAGKMYDGFSVNGMDVMVGKVITTL